ncbi:hypothetical protein CL630_02555 [bacterium]|nr:hypothetical protein [bacterium]|tara:strand:- start:25720 stop:26847 length:1128 start_codon:yes stop_codon:yes gene_type:complete
MKICFITVDFPPMIGGIPEFSRSIAHHLSLSSDVEHVQVIAPNNLIQSVEEQGEKLSILRDDKKSFFWIAWDIIWHIFRLRHHDVFHSTSVFPAGFITVFVAKYLLRKPVFVTFYGTDVLSILGSRKTRWAKAWTLKHATKAIAFSKSTRDEAMRRHNISLEQFAVVYYPLSDNPPTISPQITQSLREKHNIALDDFIVLFVGHLVKRKGPEDLLRAVSLLGNKKVKLLFVGAGPLEKDLKQQATDYGLQKRVIFAGAQDAKPYYSLASVFSMPSFFFKKEGDIEGLGIVFLEAQQYGVPVLGTNSGGIPEALEEDGSGFLVPEHDVEALAQKIKILYSNPELRKKMGKRGETFVREKFDWRKSTQEHLNLYKSK